MPGFAVGHAKHPEWASALALAAAQVDAQRARAEASGAPPRSLGFLYFSDHFAPHAQALLGALRRRWPGVSFVGACGVGVAAGGVEYLDEPALALMLAPLPAGRFEVFSGARQRRRIEAHTALVHADSATPDIAELVAEMSDRTTSGYLFGGLASARGKSVHIADGVWQGGLSGVAFTREVALVSRVTQGCQAVGPARRITACDKNLVTALDERPALQCLMEDLRVAGVSRLRDALPRLRATFVGLTDARAEPFSRYASPGAGVTAGAPSACRTPFGVDTRVRHLIGIDPGREAFAVADQVQPGMTLAFCQRDVESARRDLVRVCSEIREEVESRAEAAHHGASAPAADAARAEPRERIAGAIYVSCAGRGGPHFGAPSAELQIVRRALGEVPLVGFFAGGEIAHHHLYGYTAVLTVFATP